MTLQLNETPSLCLLDEKQFEASEPFCILIRIFSNTYRYVNLGAIFPLNLAKVEAVTLINDVVNEFASLLSQLLIVWNTTLFYHMLQVQMSHVDRVGCWRVEKLTW